MPFVVGKKKRVRDSDVVLQLQARLEERMHLAQSLEVENRRLTHQHDLIQSLCDSLEQLIQHKQEAGNSSDEEDQGTRELMHQLDSIPLSRTLSNESRISSISCQSRLASVTSAGGNMLYLFSRLVLSPANPAAATITLPQLQEMYASTVQELSLSLHLHKAGVASQTGDAANPAAPLQRIADVMSCHLHMLASLSLSQRGQLISAFLLANNETGELLPATNMEHHRWAASQLSLSREQKEQIAAGLPVFKRLLMPVLQELRQLQQRELGPSSNCQGCLQEVAKGFQQDSAHQQEQKQPPTAGNDTAGAADDCSSQHAPAQQPGVGMPEWQTHATLLDLQQQRVMRLELLLQKEYLLRSYAACYVYGAMSWLEIARLHCLMWPFSPAPAVLAQLMHEELADQEPGTL